jgi:hypothetical protein
MKTGDDPDAGKTSWFEFVSAISDGEEAHVVGLRRSEPGAGYRDGGNFTLTAAPATAGIQLVASRPARVSVRLPAYIGTSFVVTGVLLPIILVVAALVTGK